MKRCRADIFGFCDNSAFDGLTCDKEPKACKSYVNANRADSEMLGRDVTKDRTHKAKSSHLAKPGEAGGC